jgi:hypothetical protein
MIRHLGEGLIPDGDDARRWAEEELSDPRYADAMPTWFDLLARDIGRFLADLFNQDNSAGVGPSALIIVCIIIVVALIVALIVWGRPRRSRATRRHGDALLGADDDRSAAQLRADAERSARSGDWDEATVLRFRALARGLLERDLIDPAPGATAQSIAREISTALPIEAAAVRSAAASFDDVRYLRHPATEQSYSELAATDDRLVALRPELVSS